MDLNPSKLGSQGYWDKFYETELNNYSDNANDRGESWFSESGAEDKVVDFICESVVGSVLDLGTGNGQLLFRLCEEQYAGPLLGIDYSPQSIQLAEKIAADEGLDVSFKTVDFLANPEWTDEKFDLINDKGTLDAIALSTTLYDGMKGPERYVAAIKPLLKPGAILLITSCNFTEQELSDLIQLPYARIEYPSFSFGGSKGSTVVTLIFENR